MSRKFGSRVFRKPFHWSEERYEETLKEKKLFRNREELRRSLLTEEKKNA